MGTWSASIFGNDTSLDIKDEFFERYNLGEEPEDIKKDLLLDIYDEDRFNVMFALAQCMWEVGQLDESFLSDIEKVIESKEDLAVLEELGADIAIIHNGRIAAEGSLEKIIANYARSSVSLQFSQPVPSIDGWQSNGVKLLRENNTNDAGSAIADLLANPALRENTLENVHISQASLQSAYLSIVGEETNHDNA